MHGNASAVGMTLQNDTHSASKALGWSGCCPWFDFAAGSVASATRRSGVGGL